MNIIQSHRLSIAAVLAASWVALGGGALAGEPGAGLGHGDAYTPLAGIPSPEARETDRPDALPAAVSVRREGQVKAASAGSPSRAIVNGRAAPRHDAGTGVDALVTENAGPSLADDAPEPEAP